MNFYLIYICVCVCPRARVKTCVISHEWVLLFMFYKDILLSYMI